MISMLMYGCEVVRQKIYIQRVCILDTCLQQMSTEETTGILFFCFAVVFSLFSMANHAIAFIHLHSFCESIAGKKERKLCYKYYINIPPAFSFLVFILHHHSKRDVLTSLCKAIWLGKTMVNRILSIF